MADIVIRFTRQEALEQGLLICACGHPPNNHFDHGHKPCAHCDCKCYSEKARYGRMFKVARQPEPPTEPKEG